jgi:hypothetical protein
MSRKLLGDDHFSFWLYGTRPHRIAPRNAWVAHSMQRFEFATLTVKDVQTERTSEGLALFCL